MPSCRVTGFGSVECKANVLRLARSTTNTCFHGRLTRSKYLSSDSIKNLGQSAQFSLSVIEKSLSKYVPNEKHRFQHYTVLIVSGYIHPICEATWKLPAPHPPPPKLGTLGVRAKRFSPAGFQESDATRSGAATLWLTRFEDQGCGSACVCRSRDSSGSDEESSHLPTPSHT